MQQHKPILPSSIRTQLPQLLPKLPQKDRRRDPNHKRNKRQHTIPPPILQRLIHIRGKKRKPKPGKRPHKRRSRQRTGRKPAIRIDQVRLDTLVGDDVAHSEEGGADVGGDPVLVGLGGPAVDEEADGGAEGGDGEEGSAELGAAGVVVLAFEAAVDSVVERRADLRAQPEAEAEGDVVEAADANGFVVVGWAGPEGWEGGQDKVHYAVDVGLGLVSCVVLGGGGVVWAYHVKSEDLDY